MSLPVYHHVHFKTDSSEEVLHKLSLDMNTKNPVVIHLEALDREQQRECVGLIENFFYSANVSFDYPYPIYLVSELESSITGMSLVKTQAELPKFFIQKEGRMNVKETHLALKNRLLHLEIKNVDPSVLKSEITNYAETHRIIFEMESEGKFYRHILTSLKGKKRG